jgi:2-polyprenyl-3-methyl-5-hydroxy-6-metoxy-1,4-benzoquinol methylase
MEQNIYDNEEFFKGYQELRSSKDIPSANDLIEIPQFFELIGDVKDKKILDLGCGAGGHDRRLIELGAKSVLGIDISENMINEAIKNNTSDKIKYKILSMSKIEEIDEKFDLVISSLAIHYVEDYDSLCKKVFNLLNDNGEFIFSCSHPMDSAVILPKDEKRYIFKNNKKYFLISDYNNEGKRVVEWFVDGVETYHRNMSHLINGLIDAGFTIERVNESYATDEAIRLKPKFIEQKDHSYFVYIKSKKIGGR